MLVKCPECQKEVSSEASSCPHCGYPLKEEKKDELKAIDFSNCEVILERGVARYLRVLTYVLGPVFIGLFVALFIMFLILAKDVAFALVFGIILGIVIPLMIVFIVLLSIRFSNNSKLQYDNLYYDPKEKMFYAELWNKKIARFDPSESIRVGRNARGFDETVIVYKGLRYNTGYSKTNPNEANQRIAEIQSELKK